MKTRKLWLGVGVFALAAADGSLLAQSAGAISANPGAHAAAPTALAANVGADSEGGEGGEGGEAGIDAEAAENDPFAYGVALAVIAAHYHAGLAAYEAGEKEAGAQMFAHGLSEVYVEMADVFRRRGVTTLGPKLEAAVNLASSKDASVEQVRRAVREVEVALVEAERGAPASLVDPSAVRAQIAAEMIDRAAQQYGPAMKTQEIESYLDGLGFFAAAQAEARRVMPWLRARDAQTADALQAALDLAATAYPGVKHPAAPPVDAGKFLSAASSAKLAMAKVR